MKKNNKNPVSHGYDLLLKERFRRVVVIMAAAEHFFAVVYFLAGGEVARVKFFAYFLSACSFALIFALIFAAQALLFRFGKNRAAAPLLNICETAFCLAVWLVLTALFIAEMTGVFLIASSGILAAAAGLMYARKKFIIK